MDGNTHFETDFGSNGNCSAFNRECGENRVADIGIGIGRGNEMDKGREMSFFIRTYGQEAGYGERTGRGYGRKRNCIPSGKKWMLLSGCKAAVRNALQHRKIRTDAVGVSADKPQKGVYPAVAGWETE